jgi:hypothetical protein
MFGPIDPTSFRTRLRYRTYIASLGHEAIVLRNSSALEPTFEGA